MSLHAKLEKLYKVYNKKALVDPDPLAVVLRYPSPLDREVVGLVASSLAYGQVGQIVASVEKAVGPLGLSPAQELEQCSTCELRDHFRTFKHRWSTGEELVDLLTCVKNARRRYGSLRTCFVEGLDSNDETILPALARFVEALRAGSELRRNSLISEPAGGSACKRLLLYLKWMIRYDDVDPGCWRHEVSASKLIIPVDTHMHRMGLAFGMTERKQADMKTALDITRGFRNIEPGDPLKYDFVLTRVGMRDDIDENYIPMGSYENIVAKAV